ncbi:hypothetical protein D3C76_1551370 [compost metagenome]
MPTITLPVSFNPPSLAHPLNVATIIMLTINFFIVSSWVMLLGLCRSESTIRVYGLSLPACSLSSSAVVQLNF